jgi:hypothetical protein
MSRAFTVGIQKQLGFASPSVALQGTGAISFQDLIAIFFPFKRQVVRSVALRRKGSQRIRTPDQRPGCIVTWAANPPPTKLCKFPFAKMQMAV